MDGYKLINKDLEDLQLRLVWVVLSNSVKGNILPLGNIVLTAFLVLKVIPDALGY